MKPTPAFVSLCFGLCALAHPGHDHDVPGYAAEVYDSPPGLAAAAEFVQTDDSPVSGRVIAASDPVGSGTVYHFTLFGLPVGKGPFGKWDFPPLAMGAWQRINSVAANRCTNRFPHPRGRRSEKRQLFGNRRPLGPIW